MHLGNYRVAEYTVTRINRLIGSFANNARSLLAFTNLRTTYDLD